MHPAAACVTMAPNRNVTAARRLAAKVFREVNRMEERYDVAVLGGGPAGYTAALYCVRAGYSTVVLEKMMPGGQMATTDQVENYPGFAGGIDGFQLSEEMRKGAERFGAQTEFAEVKEVRLVGEVKRIITNRGALEARAVVLAMGASPRMLGLEGERMLRGKGVSYCATCDAMFYKGKTVVVVGGGNSAAEDALILSKVCRKVWLIHRRDKLDATQSYLEPLARAGNIEYRWNAEVAKLEQDGVLKGIVLRHRNGEEERLDCDGLFVAIGRTPDTQLLTAQIELDRQGYVVADETTKTNLPGVFAAGDIRTKPLRQIVTAAADGAVASKYVEEYLRRHEG